MSNVNRHSITRVVYALSCVLVVVLMTACDQQAMLEKFIPKEEAASAKRLLSQLAARDYESVENQLDPSLRTPSIRSTLEQMAAVFPSQDPNRVNVVGSNTSTFNGVTTYNLTFEHDYPDTWLLTNVVLQRRGGSAEQLMVLGLHVTPIRQSLEETNRFTFEGKTALHYIVFALVVAIPVFIVFALVLCFRTPIVRRKWLWLVFVALGLVQFSLNWTDGSYAVQPISFALLGAGFSRAGPYAPFVFTVSIPLGAIVFLARRKYLTARSEARAGAGE